MTLPEYASGERGIVRRFRRFPQIKKEEEGQAVLSFANLPKSAKSADKFCLCLLDHRLSLAGRRSEGFVASRTIPPRHSNPAAELNSVNASWLET